MPHRSLAALAFLVALRASGVSAQTATPARSAPPDSLVTRVVFTAILSTLMHDLATGAVDSASQAWSMTLPRSESPVQWERIAGELRRLLRVRPPTRDDQRIRSLSLDEVRVTADSLVLRFTSGGRSRCPAGGDWATAFTGYRLALAWKYMTSDVRPTAVLFGDGFCIAPRAP